MQKSNCDQSIDFFFFPECDGSDENKYFKLQEMKCVWLLKKSLQYFENLVLDFHYSENLI